MSVTDWEKVACYSQRTAVEVEIENGYEVHKNDPNTMSSSVDVLYNYLVSYKFLGVCPIILKNTPFAQVKR